MGFFEKVKKADKFIFLTKCQFEKGGYQNRFAINGKWMTMPTKSGLDLISDKVYVDPLKNWNKLKAKLPRYAHILNQFDWCICDSLMSTNIAIIWSICGILNVKASYAIDEPTELTSTDRLIKICQQHGATTYISGPSGGKYMEMDKFDKAGIRVEFHENKDKRPIIEVLNEII